MPTATAPDLVRIGAKLYAGNPDVIDLAAYVPIFHGWIQCKILDGVPIDVADYAHVPDGPGVMLIGHEADRSIDLDALVQRLDVDAIATLLDLGLRYVDDNGFESKGLGSAGSNEETRVGVEHVYLFRKN